MDLRVSVYKMKAIPLHISGVRALKDLGSSFYFFDSLGMYITRSGAFSLSSVLAVGPEVW